MNTIELVRNAQIQRAAATAAAKVLIVEDSSLTAQELCEWIKGVPVAIDCAIASTESAAISALSESPPDFVVLDLRLKEGSGFNVLRRVKHMQPKPTTIILTNYALPQYREFAFLSGADFFLDKALELSSVPALLESLIRDRQGLASE